MRFLRHLLAASAVVAVVVGLGFVWKGSSAASLVAEGRRDRPPGAGSQPFRRFDRRGDSGFSLASSDDLVQTLVAEGAIIAIVVAVDVSRPRRRRDATRRLVSSAG